MRSILLLLALGSATFGVAAQSNSHPDPADPAAPVPAFETQSAFAGYRSFEERPIASWRATNEAIAAGADPHAGHAGHGAGTTPEAPATQSADPHRHHHGHHMDAGDSP